MDRCRQSIDGLPAMLQCSLVRMHDAIQVYRTCVTKLSVRLGWQPPSIGADKHVAVIAAHAHTAMRDASDTYAWLVRLVEFDTGVMRLTQAIAAQTADVHKALQSDQIVRDVQLVREFVDAVAHDSTVEHVFQILTNPVLSSKTCILALTAEPVDARLEHALALVRKHTTYLELIRISSVY